MSTRDRRQARADRLRAWADTHQVKAEAAEASARGLADRIPFGQPILTGHHSEGRARRDAARITGGLDRAAREAETARDQARRADGIEGQLAGSIYSDDDDAIERLRERIAALEADRARIKAFNATCKAGTADRSLLTDREAHGLRFGARVDGGFPSYHLSNLSGNIGRQRARLVALEALQ